MLSGVLYLTPPKQSAHDLWNIILGRHRPSIDTSCFCLAETSGHSQAASALPVFRVVPYPPGQRVSQQPPPLSPPGPPQPSTAPHSLSPMTQVVPHHRPILVFSSMRSLLPLVYPSSLGNDRRSHAYLTLANPGFPC